MICTTFPVAKSSTSTAVIHASISALNHSNACVLPADRREPEVRERLQASATNPSSLIMGRASAQQTRLLILQPPSARDFWVPGQLVDILCHHRHPSSRAHPGTALKNPILSSGRLKLWTLAANFSGGMSVTTVPERWDASWDRNLKLAQRVDAAGLDSCCRSRRADDSRSWRRIVGQGKRHDPFDRRLQCGRSGTHHPAKPYRGILRHSRPV